MERGICVKVGKCAGSIVRKTVAVGKKISNAGNSCKKTASSAVEGVKTAFSSIGTRGKKEDKNLARWEAKQKDILAGFGEEVFLLYESKKKNIFEQENVKNLLNKAQDCESHIQEIKKAINEKERKKDESATFKQAVNNLKSQDPRVRRVAIRVLERLGSEEVVPHLKRATEDSDKEVRTLASEVIRKLEISEKKVQLQDKAETEPAEKEPTEGEPTEEKPAEEKPKEGKTAEEKTAEEKTKEGKTEKQKSQQEKKSGGRKSSDGKSTK